MRIAALMTLLFYSSALFGAEPPNVKWRIYPAKEAYLLGEPVFYNIELINISSKPVYYNDSSYDMCFGDVTQVIGGNRRSSEALVPAENYMGPWNQVFHRRSSEALVPACHYGERDRMSAMSMDMSCHFGIDTLQAGAKHVRRIYLDSFSFDSPGTYKVLARRRIEIYEENRMFIGLFEMASDFDIKIVQGTEAQLRTAFEPFVKSFRSVKVYPAETTATNEPQATAPGQQQTAGSGGEQPSSKQQSSQDFLPDYYDAIDVITAMAPPFLEDVILEISKSSRLVVPMRDVIAALGKLNTKRTRERLAELAEKTNAGDKSLLAEFSAKMGVNALAVAALAQTRDPSALAVLMKIGDWNDHPARADAIRNIGLLGEIAVPYLKAALKRDVLSKDSAIHGLGATASRAAVPILIDLLEKSDGIWLMFVRESLAQLTHFVDGGKTIDSEPKPDEYRHWREWWTLHGATAEIFDTNHCSDLAPLP
jgi:hypothetical protein